MGGSIGHRLTDLKTRRVAAGLTITALARRAACSDQTIIQLENGGNCLPPITERLADAFGPPTEISTSSIADPTEITTASAHGLVTGDTVTVADHADSTPDINGSHEVTVTGATTFTIDVEVTGDGTGGTVQLETSSLGLVEL